MILKQETNEMASNLAKMKENDREHKVFKVGDPDYHKVVIDLDFTVGIY